MSSRKRRSTRVGRGALSVVSGLLIGSAVVRVGAGADEAWAKAEEHLLNPAATHEFDAQPTVMDAQCKSEDDLKTLFAVLEGKQRSLTEREKKIRSRTEALAVADREIQMRLESLKRAEAALSKTLAIADEAAENDILRLVSVYENMKSKDAAALFEEMDPSFAAGFLARMQPEAAAGVMAGLSPQVAYTLSVVLAGRNAEAPKE